MNRVLKLSVTDGPEAMAILQLVQEMLRDGVGRIDIYNEGSSLRVYFMDDIIRYGANVSSHLGGSFTIAFNRKFTQTVLESYEGLPSYEEGSNNDRFASYLIERGWRQIQPFVVSNCERCGAPSCFQRRFVREVSGVTVALTMQLVEYQKHCR